MDAITNNINTKINTLSTILINDDCLQALDSIKPKSVQMVCIDPPYNIGKAEWDNIGNYNDFMLSVITKLEGKLKDNGSFFMFHNDMESIAELMIQIKVNTSFKFVQMITWNKLFDNSKYNSFMDGFLKINQYRMFSKMCEYILFFVFDNSYKIKKRREELGISRKTISNEILSKNNKPTGWYFNIETGLNPPTRETVKPITKHLGLTYEDIVPKFNNLMTHHSVWNYNMAKRNAIHITPKPIELLKNIILHSTDEGDIVLDCFAGSGSIGIACKETNRKVIMIEKEETYCDYIVKTVS